VRDRPVAGIMFLIGIMVLGLSFVANVASDLLKDERWEAGGLLGMVVGLAIIVWSVITFFKKP
jgi:hypothetical protein